MSDLSPEEAAELTANRIARDDRLEQIRQSLDIQAEMRDSPTWRFVMERIEKEKESVVDALAKISASDILRVSRLQARAMAIQLIPEWIAELVIQAHAAEEQINIEDGRLPADT